MALISLQGLATSERVMHAPYNENETDWIANKVYASRPEFTDPRVYTDVQTMIVDFKSTAAIRGAVIWDPSRPFHFERRNQPRGVKTWS